MAAEGKPKMVGNVSRSCYFLFNLSVWIFGLILIAAGGFTLRNLDVWAFIYVTQQTELMFGCWGVIVLGSIVFLVAFSGVWACIRESVFCMKVYFVCMVILVIGGLVGGILLLTSRDKSAANTITVMKDQIQNEYGKESSAAIDKGYDGLQQVGECCGADGPQDWDGSYFLGLPENADIAVPVSCCRDKKVADCNKGSPGVPTIPALVFDEGCGASLVDYNYENTTTLAMIALIMVALGTVATLLVCFIISTPRGSDDQLEKVSIKSNSYDNIDIEKSKPGASSGSSDEVKLASGTTEARSTVSDEKLEKVSIKSNSDGNSDDNVDIEKHKPSASSGSSDDAKPASVTEAGSSTSEDNRSSSTESNESDGGSSEGEEDHL